MDTTCAPGECLPRLTNQKINTFWKVDNEDTESVTVIAYTEQGILIVNKGLDTDTDRKESITQWRIFNAIEVGFKNMSEISFDEFTKLYEKALDELHGVFV